MENDAQNQNDEQVEGVPTPPTPAHEEAEKAAPQPPEDVPGFEGDPEDIEPEPIKEDEFADSSEADNDDTVDNQEQVKREQERQLDEERRVHRERLTSNPPTGGVEQAPGQPPTQQSEGQTQE